MRAYRIVVAGAGIGGLVAAIALRRAGHDPIVVERAPVLRPVGAGLTIQPNAIAALRHVDLDRAVVAAGAPTRAAFLRDWAGRDITTQRMTELVPEAGLLPVALHRGTLHEVLLGALGADRVRLGAEVASFEAGDGVRVTLRDGEVLEGDLLVGADGIRSVVRAGLVGDEPVRYSGYTCWRGITARADRWPSDASTEMWGPGRRMGVVPVDGDRLYWFAVLNAPQGGHDAEGGRAAALAVVEQCADPIPAIVAATPDDAILRNDIVDRPASDVWGRGPVTLLGDAAHAMTPNMGQGACQAIEDAVVLGHVLHGAADPIAALRRYEEARRARARWFVEQSWSFGRLAQWESGPARWLRDTALGFVPASTVRRGLLQSWSFALPPS